MNQASRLPQVKSVCCRRFFLAFLFFVMFLLAATVCERAEHGGRIRGQSTDESGGAIVRRKVTLINDGTNVSREVPDFATGELFFLEVRCCSYEVDVNQQGFKKSARKGSFSF